MATETHVAGILVHTDPAHVAELAHALRALDGIEVHDVVGNGKLVVICERDSGRAVLDQMDYMRELPGVVNVALVYQHAEPACAMDEEINDDRHPT